MHLQMLGLLLALARSSIKARALSFPILPCAALHLQSLRLSLLLQAGVGQTRGPPLQVFLLTLDPAAHLGNILFSTVDGFLHQEQGLSGRFLLC